MTLADYIALFPSNSRDKEHFIQLAEAILDQVMDLQSVVGDIMRSFSPVYAEGDNLDIVGKSLGLSRMDCSSGESTTDEQFRDYIQKKLILWGWDGRNCTVYPIMQKIKPGSAMMDNMNATVTITGAGSQPAALNKIFPVPARVSVT